MTVGANGHLGGVLLCSSALGVTFLLGWSQSLGVLSPLVVAALVGWA